MIAGFARTTQAVIALHNLLRTQPAVIAILVLVQRHSSRRNDVYNILWAVVFGFAT